MVAVRFYVCTLDICVSFEAVHPPEKCTTCNVKRRKTVTLTLPSHILIQRTAFQDMDVEM